MFAAYSNEVLRSRGWCDNCPREHHLDYTQCFYTKSMNANFKIPEEFCLLLTYEILVTIKAQWTKKKLEVVRAVSLTDFCKVLTWIENLLKKVEFHLEENGLSLQTFDPEHPVAMKESQCSSEAEEFSIAFLTWGKASQENWIQTQLLKNYAVSARDAEFYTILDCQPETSELAKQLFYISNESSNINKGDSSSTSIIKSQSGTTSTLSTTALGQTGPADAHSWPEFLLGHVRRDLTSGHLSVTRPIGPTSSTISVPMGDRVVTYTSAEKVGPLLFQINVIPTEIIKKENVRKEEFWKICVMRLQYTPDQKDPIYRMLDTAVNLIHDEIKDNAVETKEVDRAYPNSHQRKPRRAYKRGYSET